MRAPVRQPGAGLGAGSPVDVTGRLGGGAVVAVTAGASLLVYAADLVGGYGNFQNRAETAALPASYWGPPYPSLALFRTGTGGTTGIAVNNVTHTFGTADEDGGTGALTATYTSGTSPTSFMGDKRLPAGTYTFVVRGRSTTGSASAGVSLAAGGGSTGVTFGTTNTTVSRTFTIAVETNVSPNITFTSGTAATLVIEKVAIFAGSSVLPFETPTKHLLRAEGKFANTGNIINVANTGTFGGARVWLSAADATPSAMSIVAAVKSNMASETASTIAAILAEVEAASELNSSGGGLFFGVYGGGFTLMGTGVGGAQAKAFSAGPYNADWVVLTATCDATGCQLYVNNMLVVTTGAAWWASNGYRMLELFGERRTSSLSHAMDFAFLGQWDRKLTAAEVASAFIIAKQQIATAGGTFTDIKNFGIYEGDSITWGSGDSPYLGGWADRMGRLITPRLQGVNVASPGSGVGSPGGGSNAPQYQPDTIGVLDIGSSARKAIVAAKVAEAQARGLRPIVTLFSGANTPPSSGADALVKAQAIRDYWAWARSIGAKVMGCSVTDRSDWNATVKGYVATENAALVSAYNAGECDAFADFAANSNLGTWNGTYFFDLVHFSAAGHALAATIAQTAITPILL